MNYYPFHLGDYAAHTAHLDPMEDLAYRRMLDLYYRTERPLPREIEQIARLIRMKGYEEAISQVVGEFFEDCTDGWMHVRCDAEIAKMQDKQAKAKASAQASVNARSTNAQRSLNGRSTDVELPTPTPTPTPIEKKEERAQAPLPDWVPVDSWTGYVEMRKKIRKPMTARAVELIVKKLSAMQADGIDIAGVLDLSTSNAWTDVWRPTERAAKASAPTPKGDIDAYCATHRNAAWWADAGFANVYEATSSKCFHHNAALFRDGKKCEVAA